MVVVSRCERNERRKKHQLIEHFRDSLFCTTKKNTKIKQRKNTFNYFPVNRELHNENMSDFGPLRWTHR